MRLDRMHICFNLDSLTVANRNTKPLVFPRLQVLLLTGLAAVVDKLATRASFKQQLRVVTFADTAVGALFLVTCAGFACI